LAGQLQPGDIVEGDRYWARYYAGLGFSLADPPRFSSQDKSYVVVERGRRADPTAVACVDENKLAQAGGQVVYHWPVARAEESAHVVVYALTRQ
jgi:hypothetical protein